MRDCSLRICDLVGGSFPQEGPEAIKVLVAAMRDKESAEMAVKNAALLSLLSCDFCQLVISCFDMSYLHLFAYSAGIQTV